MYTATYPTHIVIALTAFILLHSSTARADDNQWLLDAFANDDLVTIQGRTLDLSGMTWPAGKTLLATGAEIHVSGYINLGSDTRIIGGHWTFSKRGFNSNGASNIHYEGVTIDALGVEFKETINNEVVINTDFVGSAAQHVGGANLTLVNCKLTSAARNGLVAQGVDHVVVDGGKYNGSFQNGVSVTGGSEHVLEPWEASDNTHYSGINVADATNVKIGSPLCIRNGEHGISLQGVDGFDIDSPMCVANKSGGISMQDHGATAKPTENGAFGGYYRGNKNGIRFIETNRNIVIKPGTTSIQNTHAQIHFNDLARDGVRSGRKSNKIVGKGLNLNTTVGDLVVNSNVSTSLNITDKHNEFRGFTGEKVATGVINLQATPITVPIDPAVDHYYVRNWTGVATDFARTPMANVIDGMIVTFCADDGAGFRFRHNAGNATTAPFWLVQPSTLVVTPNSCVTFRSRCQASGSETSCVWYELSRTIF